MLEYAVKILEQLSNVLIEPIGNEGRLRVMNALLRENGVEELPYICPYTGKPIMAAEEYYRGLQILIEHAKKSLADKKTADVVPDDFRILEVIMDESSTPTADITA